MILEPDEFPALNRNPKRIQDRTLQKILCDFRVNINSMEMKNVKFFFTHQPNTLIDQYLCLSNIPPKLSSSHECGLSWKITFDHL